MLFKTITYEITIREGSITKNFINSYLNHMHFPICTEKQTTPSQVIEKAVSKIYMSSSDKFTSFISKSCLAE